MLILALFKVKIGNIHFILIHFLIVGLNPAKHTQKQMKMSKARLGSELVWAQGRQRLGGGGWGWGGGRGGILKSLRVTVTTTRTQVPL